MITLLKAPPACQLRLPGQAGSRLRAVSCLQPTCPERSRGRAFNLERERQRDIASGALRGQSTLEYILVLSAILVGLIAIVSTTIKPAVNKAMTDSQNTIQAATGKVQAGLGL